MLSVTNQLTKINLVNLNMDIEESGVLAQVSIYLKEGHNNVCV